MRGVFTASVALAGEAHGERGPLSLLASPPAKAPRTSSPGLARGAFPEALHESNPAVVTAEPLHFRDQVLATRFALMGDHPCTLVRARRPTYWTLVQWGGGFRPRRPPAAR
jgi:hypothetical protein